MRRTTLLETMCTTEETKPQTADSYHGAGFCQNPACESCTGMNIPALPPAAFMLANGGISRNLNHDLPAEVGTEWTEHEEHVFRAIQYSGGTRGAAIRAYRRNPFRYLARRFCVDRTGQDWHFLTENARGNQTACNAECRAAATAQ
jgi:hypothetical protein